MRKGYPKKHFRAADVSSVSSVRPRIDLLHLLDQGTGLGRTWGGGVLVKEDAASIAGNMIVKWKLQKLLDLVAVKILHRSSFNYSVDSRSSTSQVDA